MTIELPEHLRSGPMADAARKSLEDAASMASASNSVPRISFRGREFRLTENGEEIAKFRDTLDVIIVGVEPEAGRMVKTFYEKGYQSGAKEPPTCSSDDGIAPSPWVTNKQSPTCQSCPKNVFGSATSQATGKQTKACRDSKRVWVKIASSQKDASGQPFKPAQGPFEERTLYGANITVASLKSFSDHGRQLAALGQPPSVCVTQMVMLDKEFPQVDFKLTGWLDAVDAPKSIEMAARRPWKVQYKNAGLALAGGDSDGGSRAALPGSLPSVPAHLQSGPTSDATVVEAKAPAAPSNKQIDDAVGNW